MAKVFPASATRDGKLLLFTRALRGFADGAISVILPSYLSTIRFGSTEIGAIVFGTLFGSALLTLAIGIRGHRFGRRIVLRSASVLMIATGIGFAAVTSFWPLLAIAVVGTLNPSAGDVSVFLPAEQSALTETVDVRELTLMFAVYNVAGAFAGAFGSLASGLPAYLARRGEFSVGDAERLSFLGYAVIGLIVGLAYLRLSAALDQHVATASAAPLGKSRGVVIKLSALFSIDAFGGGFIVQSLLALWLFRRFNLPIEQAAMFFFGAGLLGALSQFFSSALAARIGRIRTMVYTHLPASAFLIIAAFMTDARWAIVFLLLRSSVSSMDVPARQSFVMAVVAPEERTAAASVTNVPRSLASAFAPLPSGAMLNASTFGWPLIACGVLKAIYDVLLLMQFRAVRPKDEE
jgi:MFS family permease